ncbi:MAG: hypothetical protein Q4G41_00985 [Coriobacteriales bacterium]|nr:hypothetical protein [Coriobacteriales bacterium]
MAESIQSNHEPMHSEAIPPRHPAEHVGALVNVLLNERIVQGMSANQRAAAAWYACNGDRERLHTTRVFLRKSQIEGADPIICVYVDSHAYLTDLNANREIYLARLANGGFSVSGIQFGLDREAPQRHRLTNNQTTAQQADHEVTIPAEVRQRVQEMVSSLPESLQESISKAILASYLQDRKKEV